MYTYIKLAWRNIWRNKRRTFITIASVFFAIFLALIMRSFQLGSYDHMVNNVVESYTGYIQIHDKDYWNDKVIDHTFYPSDSMLSKITQIENVSLTVPRLESFSLAAYGNQTKGVLLMGVEPEKEEQMTHLKDKVKQGSYLKPGDDGCLISGRLASYLKIGINDTLVLIGVGYHGVSANGIFPVRGIISLPSPELDNKMVYLSLESAQYHFAVDHRLTSLAINLRDPDMLEKTERQVAAILNSDDYEVMTWREMLPELVQQIELDNYSGMIMLGILYLVIAFGIFGTVLMMTSERQREFGVMVAVGMQKYKLSLIVFIEMLLLSCIGLLAGIVASIPVILYGYLNPLKLEGDMALTMEQYGIEPVMPCAWESGFFVNQAIVVLIITLLSVIYPLIRIGGLKVMKAIRG
jgi:ABC-type lipoprotein release transport system permease subunit